MFQFYAGKFVSLISLLTRGEEILKSADPTEKISEETLRILTEWLDEAREICLIIKLPMSVAQIDRLKRHLQHQEFFIDNVIANFRGLNDRVSDEMDMSMFFAMPANKIFYYKNGRIFGDAVFNNFPSASFDVEEAGKCFAMARYTACVMHLQRVLEVGLKKLRHFSRDCQPCGSRAAILE